MPRTRLPLEGYRIVDMTEVWAGPFANSLLGDLGAEVVRVESYPRVAQSRPAQASAQPAAAGNLVGPPDAPRPWDRASGYHMTNRNKLAIALNAVHPKGKEVFYRLIAISDAFIIGYSAGTAARMGVDYETLRRIKPDLVMLSAPAYGEKGPYQGYVTIGSGPDAWSGHHYLRGYPDLDPTRTVQCLHIDAVAAVTMAFAITAALHYRDRTGKGQFIDFAMAEVLLNMLSRPIFEWVMNRRVVQPLGNADPTMAPHGCYPCKDPDTWITIAVRSDAQWHALRQAMGEPAWATAERFASLLGRLAHRQELDAHLAEWTRQFTPAELFQKLAAAGVPVGIVYNNDGPPADPHLAARNFYRWVTHPVVGQYRRPGPLWNMVKTPVQFRRHTNLLGEHNREVLCGLLGLSEEEVEELEALGVIGTEYDPNYVADAEDRAPAPAAPAVAAAP